MIRTRTLITAALALLCLAVPTLALASELQSESPPVQPPAPQDEMECAPPPASEPSTGDPAAPPDAESGSAPTEAPPADGATDGPDAGGETAAAEAADCEQPEVVPDVVPEPSPPPVEECPPDDEELPTDDEEELPPDEFGEEDWEGDEEDWDESGDEPLTDEDAVASEEEGSSEDESEIGEAVEEESPDAGADEPAMGEPAIGCEPYPPACPAAGPYEDRLAADFTDPLADQEGIPEPDERIAEDEPADEAGDDGESRDREEAADPAPARQLVEPVDVPREEPTPGSLAFALLGAALAFPIARVRRRRRS